MMKAQQQLGRLRRFIASVREGDPKLAEESADLGVRTEALEAMPSQEAIDHAIELESVVMRRERPVLAIKDNVTQLVFVDAADSEIWGATEEGATAP
jgi:endonuclease G, mitochondrial